MTPATESAGSGNKKKHHGWIPLQDSPIGGPESKTVGDRGYSPEQAP